MRIGFVTHQYPGTRGGGIGTYVLQAARVLAAAGHEVHIFTFPVAGGEAIDGVILHEVPDLAARVLLGGTGMPAAIAGAASGGEAVYRLGLGWLLCEAVREYQRANPERRLEVVEGPEYEALALPLMLEPVEGLAVVTQLHLCSAIAREGNVGGAGEENGETLTTDALEFASVALADGVCGPTQNIVDHTRRVSGVSRAVEVISHPMQVRGGARTVPLVGPVLFVGRLEPRKGTDLMPGAFNWFLSRNSEAVIRLVGSDTQWGGGSVREKMVAGLDGSVRGRVEFVGEKSPAEVAEEFAACRFSICPSLFESFGYVVAESLMAGRAVVVSDGIGATEVAGDAGVVFSRGDAGALGEAMERLWRDAELCKRLGGAAIRRAAEYFSREQAVDRRVAFYRRAAETSAAKQRAERLNALSQAHRVALEAALRSLATPETAGDTPGSRLFRLLEKMAPQGNARIYVYGAGRHTSRLMAQRQLWESRGHRVVGLIDDHPRFASDPTYLGLPVMSATTAELRLTKNDTIILSTDTFQEQFWRQTEALRQKGVHVLKLYESSL